MPLFGGQPNIEKLKAKGDVPGLIKALTYQQARDERRRASIQRSEAQIRNFQTPASAKKIHSRNIDALVAQLNKAEAIRISAAQALGQVGDNRSIEALSNCLSTHPDWQVRTAAARALGQLGNAQAVEALVVALHDKSADIRAAAAEALGQVGDVRVVEPLIAALKDGNTSLRQAATNALAKIGQPALDLVIATLKDENSYVRRAAAEVLDKMKWQPPEDETGVAYWIAAQQWQKCIALGSLAVDQLIVALEDKAVGGAAARTLGEIKDMRAIEALATALDAHPSRLEIAGALAVCGDSRGMDRLISAAHEKRTDENTVPEVLAHVMLSALETISTEYLRKVAQLEDISWTLVYSEECPSVNENYYISYHQPRQLARQELIRRGEQA
jgi:HEAT repeat protein